MSNAPQRRPAPRPVHPVPSPPATSTLAEVPALRWFKPDEDLTGALVLSGTTRRAIEQLELELRHTDEFLRAGLDPSTRLLFSGPSGTGKTLAARWLGWMLKLPLAVIDVSSIVSKYVGETSNQLGDCFKAAAAVPSVLFIDEIDAICAERSSMQDSSGGAELARATTTFLQQLDWLRPSRIVIAATNFHDGLDSALRRRLTTDIVFEVPDRDARRRMLAQWFARVPLSSTVVDELLDETEGMSGADLRARAMQRARAALIARMPKPAPPPPPKTQHESLQELLSNLDTVTPP